jgi:serine protease Do
MRCGSVLLALALSASPVIAAPKPPAYYPAEDLFNSQYDLGERVIAQTMLIGAGYQNAVPTERFTLHTFNATRDFQIANGLTPSGSLDRMTSDRLLAAARPMFNMWNFRQISHPMGGRPIWMPQGMGLQQYPNKNGLSYRDLTLDPDPANWSALSASFWAS